MSAKIAVPQNAVNMKPIHKSNNFIGATLCGSCRVIIDLELTNNLLCTECQEKAINLLTESVKFMNLVPNNKYGDNYSICSKIDKFLKDENI